VARRLTEQRFDFGDVIGDPFTLGRCVAERIVGARVVTRRPVRSDSLRSKDQLLIANPS